MKNILFYLLLTVPFAVFAQIDGRETVPPNGLREADVMTSKRMWRVIDLREKQNTVAKWQVAPINKILYDAAASGKLVPYLSDSLKSSYSSWAFIAIGIDTLYQETPIDPNDPTITKTDTIATPFDPMERIDQLLIMEDTYFDKKLSSMITRIIAIAPLYRLKVAGMDLGLQPLCWFKYYDPKNIETDCRDILIKVNMFNKENSRSIFTFEDWFEQRRFGSFIVKSSNLYDVSIINDPEVKKDGLESLIEAGRQKRDLYESDANQFED
jgi:gliding motility associated protien GldN